MSSLAMLRIWSVLFLYLLCSDWSNVMRQNCFELGKLWYHNTYWRQHIEVIEETIKKFPVWCSDGRFCCSSQIPFRWMSSTSLLLIISLHSSKMYYLGFLVNCECILWCNNKSTNKYLEWWSFQRALYVGDRVTTSIIFCWHCVFGFYHNLLTRNDVGKTL